MKKTLNFGIVALIIVAMFIIVTVTENNYVNNHIMKYKPSNEEIQMLADEYGIILDDNITISMVMLDYTYPDKDAAYAIRITGVDDIYTFLTTNISIDGSVTVENGIVFVDGVPIMINDSIYNYERNEVFEGGSISVLIWGGHNANDNNNPYSIMVTISFFYDDGELCFIEVGSHGYPFGDECSGRIRKEHYWEDYIFYPIFPIFK